MKCLPISVIIPTLNCRDQLERHLDASQEWLPKAQQIIAIDSNSSDGTLELLQTRLARYNAEIICTEKGLYRCWNKAVQLAEQPYVYFSTIGDLIDFEGLQKLYSVAVQNQAEVVISTPRMVDENHLPIRKSWPIHYFKDYLESLGGVMIPDKQQLWKLVSLFFPESIIGSSASNLYSTEILKQYPFPEDLGNPGDVYWALRHLPGLRVCIISSVTSQFCYDGNRSQTWSETAMLIRDLYINKLHSDLVPTCKDKNINFEDAILDYQRSTIIKLIRNCEEQEAYIKSLSERKVILMLKDYILTITSVRYWIGRYLNSENRLNNK